MARQRAAITCARATCGYPRGDASRPAASPRTALHELRSPGRHETRPQNSIADLELRSVICVPLVRIRTGQGDATSVLAPAARRSACSTWIRGSRRPTGRRQSRTAADTRHRSFDRAGECPPVEEEHTKRQMEEELQLARTIQQSLLPGKLPSDGWMRRPRQQRGIARGGRRLFRFDRGRSALLVARWWPMCREKVSGPRCSRRCCRAR